MLNNFLLRLFDLFDYHAFARTRMDKEVIVQADELKATLEALGWKQIDLARKVGVRGATVSAWATGSPIPPWVEQYLGMVLEVDRLHRQYVRPLKSAESARTETRAEAMARQLKEEEALRGSTVEPSETSAE